MTNSKRRNRLRLHIHHQVTIGRKYLRCTKSLKCWASFIPQKLIYRSVNIILTSVKICFACDFLYWIICGFDFWSVDLLADPGVIHNSLVGRGLSIIIAWSWGFIIIIIIFYNSIIVLGQQTNFHWKPFIK